MKVQHGGGQHKTGAGSRVKASSTLVDGLTTPPNTPYDNTMLTRKDIDEIRRLGQIGMNSHKHGIFETRPRERTTIHNNRSYVSSDILLILILCTKEIIANHE